ncbi:hypothetical protein WMF28_22730 [Sorangium sp. So ce590]
MALDLTRGAIGAFDRRPHATNSESATSRKLNGAFAASPRVTWKTIAPTISATQPSAASTASTGSMRVAEGSRTTWSSCSSAMAPGASTR